MAENITFAFVLTENLDRKSFKVPQAVVAIDVKGAVDPLTHQKARDAVEDLFHRTQKAINDDIAQRDLRITRMGINERRLKKRGEIENGNRKIQDLLAAFRKDAMERLSEWREKEEERSLRAQQAQSRENWKGITFTLNSIWTGIKFVLDVGEVVTAPSSLPLVVNQFVANLLEVKGLFEDYAKVYADCPAMRRMVKDSLSSMKSKGRPTRSDVETFARDVGLLDDKLLVLELRTKATASRVTALISAVPPKGSVKPEAIRKAEEALHTCLTGLVSAAEEIGAAQKHLVLMKKHLGLAKANAKKDNTYGWAGGWAATVYKSANDFKDFLLKPTEWITQVDGVIKFFTAMGNLKVGG